MAQIATTPTSTQSPDLDNINLHELTDLDKLILENNRHIQDIYRAISDNTTSFGEVVTKVFEILEDIKTHKEIFDKHIRRLEENQEKLVHECNSLKQELKLQHQVAYSRNIINYDRFDEIQKQVTNIQGQVQNLLAKEDNWTVIQRRINGLRFKIDRVDFKTEIVNRDSRRQFKNVLEYQDRITYSFGRVVEQIARVTKKVFKPKDFYDDDHDEPSWERQLSIIRDATDNLVQHQPVRRHDNERGSAEDGSTSKDSIVSETED